MITLKELADLVDVDGVGLLSLLGPLAGDGLGSAAPILRHPGGGGHHGDLLPFFGGLRQHRCEDQVLRNSAMAAY